MPEPKRNEEILATRKFDIVFIDGKGLSDCELVQRGRYTHLVKDGSGRTVLVSKGAVKYYALKEETT